MHLIPRLFVSAASLVLITTLAKPSAAQAQRDDPRGDLAAEIVGATFGFGVGAAVGFAAVYGGARALDCDGDEDAPCLFPVFFGIPAGVLVALFTIPAGVDLAADATGGRGSYWASFLGSALVVAPGIGALMLSRPDDAVLFPALAGLAALWITGAIVGNRVSAPDMPSFAIAPARDGRGATLSLAGRF